MEGKGEEEAEEEVVVVVEEFVCDDEDTGITCGRNKIELPPFDDLRYEYCTVEGAIERTF